MNDKYYDGTKLLSLKDINSETPEIFLCTSNRSAGKTTYFSRYLVNRFLKYGEKFMLIYRFNYELDNVADKFFKDISELFFKGYYMKSERRANGIYHELFIGKNEKDSVAISCGYAVALNGADQIKKNSHLFSDTARMLMDEFQSETAHYCQNEVNKLMSVHNSVARGRGEQSRYVPLIMLSNPVSIINPYYIALGISARLRDDTKFLRGDGFVLEQGYVDSASNALKKSAFNRAFGNNDYMNYATQAVYLNDNKAFIAKPEGRNRYLATIRCYGRDYAIREYPDTGILYCDDRPDTSYKHKISVTTEDHKINYVMLRSNDIFVQNMRFYFERGCFRFKDLRSKEALMTLVSY